MFKWSKNDLFLCMEKYLNRLKKIMIVGSIIDCNGFSLKGIFLVLRRWGFSFFI